MRTTEQQRKIQQQHNKGAIMRGKSFITAVILVCLTLPALAMASNAVDIKIKAEKIAVIVKDGKKIEKNVPAKKFQPGDTIIYTISYSNNSGEPAKDAVIDDPVPQGTTYVHESASGAGADITFSIDGGKTFKKPTLLMYQVDTGKGGKEQRVASPDQYTNIRWTLSSIPPKGSGKVTFKVKVK